MNFLLGGPNSPPFPQPSSRSFPLPFPAVPTMVGHRGEYFENHTLKIAVEVHSRPIFSDIEWLIFIENV